MTDGDLSRSRAIASRNGAVLAEVSIRAKDGAVLKAWSIVPVKSNGGAVILLHGQSDNRVGMMGNADLLLRNGYAVLLPDARAHGESGGAIATHGVLESDDIHKWVEWLEQNDSPRCVYGLGDSMGGGQLLNSLADGPRFCAVIAESPFSDFRSSVYDRLGQEFGAGAWLGRTVFRPVATLGSMYAKWKYGIDLERDSPIRSAASSHTPIFLIHGLADENLPSYHSERIKAADDSVVLWEPPNAGHCGAYEVAPAEYERRVVAWFRSHDKAGSALKLN